MNFLYRPVPSVTAGTALAGRVTPVNLEMADHAVLGAPIDLEPAGDQQVIYLAMGCFWGAEKLYWNLGADSTAVGYMGGYTPNPTYQEACTGLTGHTETVRVVYSPDKLSLEAILQAFFESHDPTSLNKQGGDVGTQYRSAIFPTTEEQTAVVEQMRDLYQGALDEHGRGQIVTEIHDVPAPEFFYAEDYHQQYLQKNPGGYECHARTGVPCPLPR